LAIEGLGRQLYPELDLWATAKPFLERWLRQQIGPKAFFNQLKQNLPFFAEQLPHLPKLIFDVFELKKQQLLAAQELVTIKQEPRYSRIQWGSMALGVFASFLSLGILNYFSLIDSVDITPVAITVAALAGLFALIKRKVRS